MKRRVQFICSKENAIKIGQNEGAGITSDLGVAAL